MRADGGHEEKAEGDAADLQVLPQRVGDGSPPDRPREPHDRRTPAPLAHAHPVVAVAVSMVPVAVVVMVVVVAVGAWGEEQGAARKDERGSGG